MPLPIPAVDYEAKVDEDVEDRKWPADVSLRTGPCRSSGQLPLNKDGPELTPLQVVPTLQRQAPVKRRRRRRLLFLILLIATTALIFAVFAFISVDQVGRQLQALEDQRVEYGQLSQDEWGSSESREVAVRRKRKRKRQAICSTKTGDILRDCATSPAPTPVPGAQFVHFTGCNFSRQEREEPCVEVKTSLEHSPRPVPVVDWRPSANQTATFSIKDGQVTINKAGVFFVYSQFYLVNGGVKCTYRLTYGEGSHDYISCIRMINSVTSSTSHNQEYWRSCYLGFATRLKKGAKISLEFYDPYGYCQEGSREKRTNQFKKGLMHSYWGVIQLGANQ